MGSAPSPGSLSPLYFVYAAARQVGALLGDALDGAPLDAEQYALYSAIREDQPVSPTALARRLGVPFTSLLDDLAKLRRAGHVVRHRNPDDRRSYLIELTPTGDAAHRATHDYFERADLLVTGELGDGREQLIATLEALRRAVEAAHQRLRREALDRLG